MYNSMHYVVVVTCFPLNPQYHHALRMDTRTNRVRQRLDIRLTVFERHMTNDCVLTDYRQDRNTFLTNTDRQNVTLYQLKKRQKDKWYKGLGITTHYGWTRGQIGSDNDWTLG